MELQTTHCAQCDKTVHVALTAVVRYATHANVPDGGQLVCLDVGEDCAGMMCPLSGSSTLLMAVRLAQSGVVPDEDWPHVQLVCDRCGREVGREVLDGGHAFCPLCKTINTVALYKKTDGTYEVAVNSWPRQWTFIRLFGRYLRDQGLPVTQQRQAVAEVVFTSDAHVSVDDIDQQLRGGGDQIGKATIYRTLDLLVRSRLVEEHDFGEGFKRYEHRLSQRPVHEHLICLECGIVLEFESRELYSVENRVRREHGFVPLRHRLEIYGLCQACDEAGVELPTEGLICPIEAV